MRRRLILILVAVASVLLGTVGFAGPAVADAGNVVAIHEVEWSHGSDILNARIGIERTSDSTQGRYRLHLRCFWINQDTGKRTAQLCDFDMGFADACWYDVTVGSTSTNPVCRYPLTDVYSDADVTWVGTTYRTLVRGHTYRVFSRSFRVLFHNSGYQSEYHSIASYDYTH